MRKRIANTDKDIYEYKNKYIKIYIQVWTKVLSLNETIKVQCEREISFKVASIN